MFHIAQPIAPYQARSEDKAALEIGHGEWRILAAASRCFNQVIRVDIHDHNDWVEVALRVRAVNYVQLIRTEGAVLPVGSDHQQIFSPSLRAGATYGVGADQVWIRRSACPSDQHQPESVSRPRKRVGQVHRFHHPPHSRVSPKSAGRRFALWRTTRTCPHENIECRLRFIIPRAGGMTPSVRL